MAKYTYTNNNFSSGEISSKLEGRSDLKQYSSGVGELLNFIPYRTGGVSRRPGTRVLREITAEFTGSDIPEYVIDYRIADEHFLVVMGGTTSSLKLVVYRVVGGSNLYTQVPVLVDTGISLLSKFVPSYVQVGHTLVVCDKSGINEPIVLIGSTGGAATYSFVLNTYHSHADSLLESTDHTVLTTPIRSRVFQSRHRGNTSITTVLDFGISYDLTASDDIFLGCVSGDLLRIKSGSTEWVYALSVITSATVVAGTLMIGTGAPPVSKEWALESWTKKDGFPTSVGYFQGRLAFGGTKTLFGVPIAKTYSYC